MAVDDGAEAPGDFVDRLVPGDALEAALAFLACAAQGMEQAVGGAGVIEKAVELHAQRAARVGVVAVALQLDGAAALDGDHPTAGVGAVHRAGAADAAG